MDRRREGGTEGGREGGLEGEGETEGGIICSVTPPVHILTNRWPDLQLMQETSSCRKWILSHYKPLAPLYTHM